MGSLPSGLSGSRAAAIVGLSRFRSAVEVWLDIMEEREPPQRDTSGAIVPGTGFCASNGFAREEFKGNASTRWGLGFESAVIQLAEIEQGERVVDCERLFIHAEVSYATAHVDGIFSDSKTLHEGKTTNAMSFRDDWGEPGTDHVPQEYQVQVQHALMVSGLPRAVVSVLVFPERPDGWEAAGLRIDPVTHVISGGHEADPDDRIGLARERAAGTALVLDSSIGWARVLRGMGFFHRYEIEANAEVQAALLDTYRDFWAVNVLGRVPPTPTKYDDCRKLFTAPKGTIVADEKLERLAAEYKAINAELAAMAKRKDQIRTTLITDMTARAEVPVDDDSVEKIVLRGASGKRLVSYDGKVFR